LPEQRQKLPPRGRTPHARCRRAGRSCEPAGRLPARCAAWFERSPDFAIGCDKEPIDPAVVRSAKNLLQLRQRLANSDQFLKAPVSLRSAAT
jgi:hypothetical protein